MHLKIESACNGLFLKERDKGYYGWEGRENDEDIFGNWGWRILTLQTLLCMTNPCNFFTQNNGEWGMFLHTFFFNPKSPFIIVYNKQVLVVNKKLTFIATWIIMSAFILWIISDQLVDGMQNLCNEQRVSSLAS